MRFQTPLIPARLIRRYKRFLSDMRLEDGTEVTAHCPNPGSMMGMQQEGLRCWLEPNEDPKKKLKYGWRLVEMPDGALVGVDTGTANRIVAEALAAQKIPALAAYATQRAEVKYGANSRIDFLLSAPGLPDAYVEVKSVTLSRTPGLAEFPDSVTARGAKHLVELENMVTQGHRAVMLYLVQRTDCTAMQLAGDIDPTYAAAFAKARQAGVEVICCACQMSPQGITLTGPIATDL
ncbi:DNA/RNA nuclease SfsA [Ascidiaceihabitans sp.]|uniref:DNA/RNA nuclease SfsA n=1 Tax=Ascidiaceihabitans sp. TaxID=1872644 RepID=UPI003296D76A